MSRKTVGVLLLTFAVTLLLEGTAMRLRLLWPPLAALLVIMVTRQALVGLLMGSAAGALLLSGGDPLQAGSDLVSVHLLPNFQNSWKLGALVFTLVLGGFAAVLEAGGGFETLLRRVAGSGRDQARQLETAAAGLGLLCFFDGLANSMVVGRVGRDLADRSGVARVKLAYIADSTSSAVACVAIISTWIAFQLSMIAEAYTLAGRDVNAYQVFLHSLPYNFYCWFTLVMMFVAIRLRFHPGPMGALVRAAEAAGVRPPQTRSPRSAVGSSTSVLVPLGVLLIAFFAFFLLLGTSEPLFPLTRAKVVAAFGSDAGPRVLVLSGATATLAAMLLFPAGVEPRWKRSSLAFLTGVRTMGVPILILVAAWMLGSVINALGTAAWIAGLAAAVGSPILLPSLVFVTGAVISFSTGTSWGTMGLLFPLAVPAAVQLGTPDAGLPVIVAAVFSGAVFGDHCSPFSDTTIVTSISCGVEPHDHVRTQIPYALITAALAVLLGFLPAGLGWPAPLSLLAGVSALLLLPHLGRRPAKALA